VGRNWSLSSDFVAADTVGFGQLARLPPVLILPPQHYQETHKPRVRGRRDRWFKVVGALMAVAIVAVTLISLTSHQAKSSNGCLNFEYTMVMGAENVHECDAPARKLCADPKSANQAQGHIAGLENDLIAGLAKNCREAGLPYNTGS
jgi:hypothetical protein